MKITVEIHETSSRLIEVEAKDKIEAIDKVQEAYSNGEYVLDHNDFQEVEFNII
jgi:hypothetical protein